ncbi:MAG: MotA/TolQ/ExbB proton channel family protein [Prevotella sp.]|nr:MotA/TolQ/ExbB proton channel family protein [Prevotella sp.]MCM1075256.1 MotA/TolQ/ExbB proton channel family protein [Ruminococcus sp.]
MEATTPKPAAPKAVAKKEQKISNVKGISSAFLVILACAALAICLFMFVMGSEENFSEGDPVNGHPLNYLGTVYKGGFIVPILITLLFTVIVLSIERWIALSSAKGKGSVPKFVLNIKQDLAAGKIDQALNRCKAQKGSVAAVVHAVLVKYKEMDANTVLSKEQKLTILRNEVEEATALEMPSLQQNLPIVATLTTLGTLVGLLGTVLGMIKSFQALANSGAPDATQLSTGISEALINTATGIATGALAVISYNFYTNKIDNLTYAIDEVGFSIVATFSATH